MKSSSNSFSIATARDSASEPIGVHEVGWLTIVLFLAAACVIMLLFSLTDDVAFLTALAEGPSWRNNVVTFGTLYVVTIGVVLFGVGRLRPADLGLASRKFLVGFGVTAVVWLLVASVAAVSTGGPILNRVWRETGAGPVLRWAVVMFVFTALYEEIAFRGFLFPQLALKLGTSSRTGYWGAVVLSQLVFAAYHLPTNVLYHHMSGAALANQFSIQTILGIILLLIYLRTRNLWIAVGIHGLVDAPTPLFAGTTSVEIWVLILLIGWHWIVRAPAHRGLAAVDSLGPP
ncbi:MAG: type II CAAX endopeptidase family protein [Gemmatimonadaceae bacterium]